MRWARTLLRQCRLQQNMLTFAAGIALDKTHSCTLSPLPHFSLILSLPLLPLHSFPRSLPLSLLPSCPSSATPCILQLKAEVSRLSEAEASATSTRSELLAAKQEAAHLKGQLEAKDRTAAGLENELCTLREQQKDAGAAQHKQQQELDVVRAEVARLQGQLGAAGRLQGQLGDLLEQLAAATQRETTLQQQKAVAERDAQQKATQVCRQARDAEKAGSMTA